MASVLSAVNATPEQKVFYRCKEPRKIQTHCQSTWKLKYKKSEKKFLIKI